MSILIKGMEMPKSCMNCMFCGFAGADCELDLCQITGNAQKHIPYSKMPDCPLAEIPQHGRLIDADKIGYHSGTWEKGCDWVMQSEIALMPTVIPADKDGET